MTRESTLKIACLCQNRDVIVKRWCEGLPQVHKLHVGNKIQGCRRIRYTNCIRCKDVMRQETSWFAWPLWLLYFQCQ